MGRRPDRAVSSGGRCRNGAPRAEGPGSVQGAFRHLVAQRLRRCGQPRHSRQGRRGPALGVAPTAVAWGRACPGDRGRAAGSSDAPPPRPPPGTGTALAHTAAFRRCPAPRHSEARHPPPGAQGRPRWPEAALPPESTRAVERGQRGRVAGQARPPFLGGTPVVGAWGPRGIAAWPSGTGAQLGSPASRWRPASLFSVTSGGPSASLVM